MTNDQESQPIRITREDAMSPRVDDLLKRQLNLRGDLQVSRNQPRAWYFHNWFIFGLVGALGAAAAWACLTPFFDDHYYLQGPITYATDTVMMVRGETVVIGSMTRVLSSHGATVLDPAILKVGSTVGVYFDILDQAGEAMLVADFVRVSPPAQSPAAAKRTLSDLKARRAAAGLLLFPIVAGMVGLFIGAADGLICRLPRRALLCGAVGLGVGLVGGLVSGLFAEVVYSPLSILARNSMEAGGAFTSFGFALQVMARALAWCLAGIAIGLGQGIALRSSRLFWYGLLGGILGGLLGGLLFDPIDVILGGANKPSALWSRLAGFVLIGTSVGAFIGIVELLARDAWLRMTQGPLSGKEFLLFKDRMLIGSSPRSDIYLFKDEGVAPEHAAILVVGDECEIEARQKVRPVLVNQRAVGRARLRHGDSIGIGRTVLVFQQRKN